ncbi:MAG: 23S rRNA (guanosine(2251)-2'-O)-methyltransferase RlmB, partial [Maribacter sp.]|nr:23S rRNA (guanosine(2251)-2'-O)-methyltransferase RlmB [Maribacter sp.]
MQNTSQIYGIRAVLEAIKAKETVDKVFIQKGLKGELSKELESALRKNGIPVSYVPIEKLNRLTPQNHQGVVATISPISFYELEALVEKVLAT